MLFPGEFCRTTGVYKVVHYLHRLPHHVSVNEAEPFPVCRKCQSKVRYFRTEKSTQVSAAEAVSLIVEDPDLSSHFVAR